MWFFFHSEQSDSEYNTLKFEKILKNLVLLLKSTLPELNVTSASMFNKSYPQGTHTLCFNLEFAKKTFFYCADKQRHKLNESLHCLIRWHCDELFCCMYNMPKINLMCQIRCQSLIGDRGRKLSTTILVIFKPNFLPSLTEQRWYLNKKIEWLLTFIFRKERYESEKVLHQILKAWTFEKKHHMYSWARCGLRLTPESNVRGDECMWSMCKKGLNKLYIY